MSRSLIVLPDDSARPILDAINHSAKSLRIKMFVFSDPAILQAVIAAQKRGVSARVMLNPARRSGESENEQTRKMLKSAGVDVLDSSPQFDLTHEKSMVVDDETAFVMSFNWEPKDLTETRDYAVVTSAHHEVSEVMECFDADWSRKPFTPGENSHLIWCVGNGRERIGRFIDEAGVKVHKLKGLKLHAKLLLADNVRGIVGSINLAPGSFDSRRECAIEVRDED